MSWAFTPGASVSEKTRARVREAAGELGYSPNALASSLTTGRTKLIGLVSNNFYNPIFPQVFDLFTRGLQDRGLPLLLVNLSDERKPGNSVALLRQYSVDGVIVASSTLPPGFSRAFRDAGVTVVHSFGRYAATPEVHVVGIDNVACGRMAARTLLTRGYRRLGFLGGPERASSTQERWRGFLDESQEHGITARFSFAAQSSFDAGRSEMAQLLASDPTKAYCCGDDALSIGALSAIGSAGLTCPGDVGIVGLNDMEMVRWQNIELTTIHQPIGGIIAASIELVVAMLADPGRLPEARPFDCHIVEKGTLRAAR